MENPEIVYKALFVAKQSLGKNDFNMIYFENG